MEWLTGLFYSGLPLSYSRLPFFHTVANERNGYALCGGKEYN
jgi:hypothetical protein